MRTQYLCGIDAVFRSQKNGFLLFSTHAGLNLLCHITQVLFPGGGHDEICLPYGLIRFFGIRKGCLKAVYINRCAVFFVEVNTEGTILIQHADKLFLLVDKGDFIISLKQKAGHIPTPGLSGSNDNGLFHAASPSLIQPFFFSSSTASLISCAISP